MDKKMIFFDIDGTLLDDEKKLPDSTREAIAQLKLEGHTVAIATGRSPFTFATLLEELDIDSYVSLNGQYVVYQGEPIYRNPLTTEDLNELKKYAGEKQHPLVYVNHEDWYADTENHENMEVAIDSLKVDQKLRYDPEFYLNGEVYQVLLFSPTDNAGYHDKFEQLDFIRWHEYSVDVLPFGGSKAAGINKMIEHLGFSQDDVYAFGDGLNDIKMLEAVKNSVAMGNAPGIVKQAAKMVTKDVHDDGLLYGLKMVGLVK